MSSTSFWNVHLDLVEVAIKFYDEKVDERYFVLIVDDDFKS